jgi:hypothetical protein
VKQDDDVEHEQETDDLQLLHEHGKLLEVDEQSSDERLEQLQSLEQEQLSQLHEDDQEQSEE